MRRKALSSLMVEDCEAYKDFLKAPLPSFTGPKRPRTNGRWRPFAPRACAPTVRRTRCACCGPRSRGWSTRVIWRATPCARFTSRPPSVESRNIASLLGQRFAGVRSARAHGGATLERSDCRAAEFIADDLLQLANVGARFPAQVWDARGRLRDAD